MIELLSGTKFIPSWAIQYILAGLIWFGLNYILITPIIFDRVTLPYKKEFVESTLKYNSFHFNDEISDEKVFEYVDCIYSKYFYSNRQSLTIWTASMGYENLLESHLMEKELNRTISDGICGDTPWKI